MEPQETNYLVETVEDALGFCEIRAVVKNRHKHEILAEIEVRTLDHVIAARLALRYAGLSKGRKLRKVLTGKNFCEFSVWQ